MYRNGKDQYDYSKAGFDNFLLRSISGSRNALPDRQQGGSGSTAMNFDRSQVGGSLGNILRIGHWVLDGVNDQFGLVNENGDYVAVLGRRNKV
jgi:hypothetical protein